MVRQGLLERKRRRLEKTDKTFMKENFTFPAIRRKMRG